MFGHIGNEKVFFKIELKIGFPQMKAKLETIEKITFKKKYSQLDYLFIAMGPVIDQ